MRMYTQRHCTIIQTHKHAYPLKLDHNVELINKYIYAMFVESLQEVSSSSTNILLVNWVRGGHSFVCSFGTGNTLPNLKLSLNDFVFRQFWGK